MLPAIIPLHTFQLPDGHLQNELYYLSWIEAYKIFHLFDHLLGHHLHINTEMGTLVYPMPKSMRVYWIQQKYVNVYPSHEHFVQILVEQGLDLRRMLLPHEVRLYEQPL